MRPVRLQLQGFTAFRDRSEIVFGDEAVFALTGPTGSGKSSLIDAMVFALYGSVPRYGDRRAVEPVISLGREEARVRFDFTVGGAEFSAARVVRRTKHGATTAEARLEGPGTSVLGAREVTDAVEQLLGLGFDHFTKSVVLPQGAFAEFLHDSGSERRALLRRLLDVDIYGRVRALADARAKEAEIRVEYLTSALADLTADEDAVSAAKERIARLESVRSELVSIQPEIESAVTERADLEARRRDHTGLRTMLEDIAVPPDTSAISTTIDARRAARDQAATRLEEADAAVSELEASLGDRPSSAELQVLLGRHETLASLVERRSEGQRAVNEAEGAVERAGSRLEEIAALLASARARLHDAERTHAAHVLADGLAPGDECPVCLRTVEVLPDRELPPDLEEARAGIADLEGRHAEAEAAQQEAVALLERRRAMLESLADQVVELDEEVGDEPVDAVRERHRAVSELEGRVEVARRARSEAAASLRDAARDLERAEREAEAAWKAFDATRDRIAPHGPPAADRGDLAGSWAALVAWATKRAEAETEAVDRLSETIAEIDHRIEDLDGRITDLLAREGLKSEAGERPGEIVASAIAAERSRLGRMTEELERAAIMREELGARTDDGRVARTLALHLRSDRFEAWLLEEAFAALVAGANRRLDELTRGGYSLTADDQGFAVVDHGNADQRRGVRTLSGGETFLVSLALALALSEQLSELAVDGAARLESVFLDEGFGTLDADALDLVAGVIDELGASGRTVGIVTHVTELAERMPVRFEVRKVGPASVVERVES